LQKCQNCGHPVLEPNFSDYCTNCCKRTGALKVDAIDPKYGELLFVVPSILGKSYKFFKDRFVIYQRSSKPEEIPYSSLKDCNFEFTPPELSDGFPGELRITITLDGDPERQIEFTGNPMNARINYDLAFWLNTKLGENEAKRTGF
jgi:hypothetical protein